MSSPTTGGGTTEECHKGRTSGKLVKFRPRICEHLTWCCNLLVCQPFNPQLTYYFLSTCKCFRSGKCEECRVSHNSIRNTISCYIFFAINISLINRILFNTGVFTLLINWRSISIGWLHNIAPWPKSHIGCWLIKVAKPPIVFILIDTVIAHLVRNKIAYLCLFPAEV